MIYVIINAVTAIIRRYNYCNTNSDDDRDDCLLANVDETARAGESRRARLISCGIKTVNAVKV